MITRPAWPRTETPRACFWERGDRLREAYCGDNSTDNNYNNSTDHHKKGNSKHNTDTQ